MNRERLRLAIIAGTLGRAGAEKQLVYLVRSLRRLPVDVRVYSLTHGEHYESALAELGCPPVWIGQVSNPLLRLVEFIRLGREVRPHIIHSAHFYTNLYAGLAGHALSALSTGSSRTDPRLEVADNGNWGRWLVRATDGMIANSYNARDVLVEMGLPPEKVHVLPNVIDLEEFDRNAAAEVELTACDLRVVLAGRLVKPKRVDLFLQALAEARRRRPEICGLVVGDGPLRADLESLAAGLNLLDNGGVQLLGHRSDVAALLAHSDVLASTSEYEGFPNVLLEAMAARLPVVATPAGDSPRIVQDGETGFLLPLAADQAVQALADRLVELAADPERRAGMGAAGRHRVEEVYALNAEPPNRLEDRLVDIFCRLAETARQSRVKALLEQTIERA